MARVPYRIVTKTFVVRTKITTFHVATFVACLGPGDMCLLGHTLVHVVPLPINILVAQGKGGPLTGRFLKLPVSSLKLPDR